MIKSVGALLSFLFISQTLASHCFFKDDKFHVEIKGDKYSLKTDDWSGSKVLCEKEYAAAYDGDSIIVFDILNKKFHSANVENNFRNLSLRGSNDLVSFYDGNKIYIFDLLNSKWIVDNTDNYSSGTTLDLNNHFVLFYDRDEIYFYDFIHNTNHFVNVNNGLNNPFFKIFELGAFFYDLDDIYFFCNGKSFDMNADNSQYSPKIHTIQDHYYKIEIGSDSFYFDSKTCKATKR